MTWFLIIGAVLVLCVLAIVLRPLFSRTADTPARDAQDAQFYRDQLAEIDRDLARGVLSETEAEGARAEISRRLIRAGQRLERSEGYSTAPREVTGLAAGIALVGAPALAVGVYLIAGAPGLPDLPLEERVAAAQARQGPAPRLSQEEAERQFAERPGDSAGLGLPDLPKSEEEQKFAEMIFQLEKVVAERPQDIEGRRLLANGYMRLERYASAWPVYAEMIRLMGDEAPAGLYAQQGEAMVLAAGGYVSPEAQAVIDEALERDPSSPIARYYSGLGLAQNDRLDEAIGVWEQLRAEAPADAPWRDWLDQMLAQAYDFRNQQAMRGPSAEDVAAAQSMSPEQRLASVEEMVTRLENRLLSQGGSRQEWDMLIRSYRQLGRSDDVARIEALAKAALGDGVTAAPAQPAPTGGAGSGPTAEDMAAASQMTPEDRQAMILGMVQRLEDRLTSEGGPAEEWMKLINAYAQLDKMDDARRVYDLAQAKLGPGPEASFIRERALVLGVISE